MTNGPLAHAFFSGVAARAAGVVAHSSLPVAATVFIIAGIVAPLGFAAAIADRLREAADERLRDETEWLGVGSDSFPHERGQ